MNRRRRVVVTGLGVVAPIGIEKEAFWQRLIAGESGIRPISLFDASPYPCQIAGEIESSHPESFMRPARVKHRGRFSQLAVAAAKLAVHDAGLELKKIAGDRILSAWAHRWQGSVMWPRRHDLDSPSPASAASR